MGWLVGPNSAVNVVEECIGSRLMQLRGSPYTKSSGIYPLSIRLHLTWRTQQSWIDVDVPVGEIAPGIEAHNRGGSVDGNVTVADVKGSLWYAKGRRGRVCGGALLYRHQVILFSCKCEHECQMTSRAPRSGMSGD